MSASDLQKIIEALRPFATPHFPELSEFDAARDALALAERMQAESVKPATTTNELVQRL